MTGRDPPAGDQTEMDPGGSRPVVTHLQVGCSLVATSRDPPPGEPPPTVPLVGMTHHSQTLGHA